MACPGTSSPPGCLPNPSIRTPSVTRGRGKRPRMGEAQRRAAGRRRTSTRSTVTSLPRSIQAAIPPGPKASGMAWPDGGVLYLPELLQDETDPPAAAPTVTSSSRRHGQRDTDRVQPPRRHRRLPRARPARFAGACSDLVARSVAGRLPGSSSSNSVISSISFALRSRSATRWATRRTGEPW